ncbi:8422_t:CDS:2 [Funneliformis mosseae]|uniref:8422_t:CDS:1 n=1 Tax=Funneliformis mosseae TaxID=27381 RepID=A0A9N8ZKT7_FUNMO|nr:8422_t:CDS:2 [Funneliformis mosseae]
MISNSSGEKFLVKMSTSDTPQGSLAPKSRTPISRTDPNKMEHLNQNAIEHVIDSEKFLIISELRKKDGKYYTFLTDRDRLIGEEVLRHDILESRLSTIWLEEFMKKMGKAHTQFILRPE